jgi:molecular chaperone DnaK
MAPFQRPAVGIDLGTTLSVLAVARSDGRIETVPNAEGHPTTPSAVYFQGTEWVAGQGALDALTREPDAVAIAVKRELGEPLYHKLLGGRQYPPEALEAMILHKLRHDARAVLGDFHQAVITVPAYFDEVRRKATQDAGYMAGFEVLDIINEPTAAAIAYGRQEGFLDERGAPQRPLCVLVYDLGGGTFDVTVMRIEAGRFTALATDGDVRLGGHDWDDRLVDYVAGELRDAHGIEARERPERVARLWRECEAAKQRLTAADHTSIELAGDGRPVRIELTRRLFADLTRDLLDRTRFTSQQALQAARLQWNKIDRVLLVGGSTRMPMVRDMLRELTGQEPDASLAADEAVAHGAALRARTLLEAGESRPKLKVRNVNSHSLGLVARERATGRRRTAVIIPRNTPLPAQAKRVFRTKRDGQKSVLVEVVEGETPSPDDCVPLGRCTARGLPPNLRAGTGVEVGFHYEQNGRLVIEVRLATDERQLLTHELFRENMLSQDQLDRWREFITGMPMGAVAGDGRWN